MVLWYDLCSVNAKMNEKNPFSISAANRPNSRPIRSKVNLASDWSVSPSNPLSPLLRTVVPMVPPPVLLLGDTSWGAGSWIGWDGIQPRFGLVDY